MRNWLQGMRSSVDHPPEWIWLCTSHTPFHASSDPWAFMMKSFKEPRGVVLKPMELMPSLYGLNQMPNSSEFST